jgi:hypothetical protein
LIPWRSDGSARISIPLNHRRGKPALREDRRALHEQDHVIGADLVLDLLKYRILIHLALLFRNRCL